MLHMRQCVRRQIFHCLLIKDADESTVHLHPASGVPGLGDRSIKRDAAVLGEFLNSQYIVAGIARDIARLRKCR